MKNNDNLRKAKTADADEFYTMMTDIEKEIRCYPIETWQNKTILCNCDDPYESNFFKFFCLNFHRLGLKKLIATCLGCSSFSGEQLSFFDIPSDDTKSGVKKIKKAYKAVITDVPAFFGEDMIEEDMKNPKDAFDPEELFKYGSNSISLLKGSGDFRSYECVELLKEVDICVTNVPFSLFREYVALMERYNKKYLILGSQNAITYRDVFPLLKNEKLWLGASIHNGDREFRVPDDYPLEALNTRIDEHGNKYIRVKGIRWFTNLDYKQRHEELTLKESYSPEKYPKYDNYNAINVDKTACIPYDYTPCWKSCQLAAKCKWAIKEGLDPNAFTLCPRDVSSKKCNGVMGVPVTFLDKYSPGQFNLLGIMNTTEENKGIRLANTPHGRPVVNGKELYLRILIRQK